MSALVVPPSRQRLSALFLFRSFFLVRRFCVVRLRAPPDSIGHAAIAEAKGSRREKRFCRSNQTGECERRGGIVLSPPRSTGRSAVKNARRRRDESGSLGCASSSFLAERGAGTGARRETGPAGRMGGRREREIARRRTKTKTVERGSLRSRLGRSPAPLRSLRGSVFPSQSLDAPSVARGTPGRGFSNVPPAGPPAISGRSRGVLRGATESERAERLATLVFREASVSSGRVKGGRRGR